MAEPFRFKKFTIQQHDEVFKVGTDGVLLGAWVHLQRSSKQLHFADWGTGSGLIGIMMAQRFNQAIIDLVDAHPKAVELAQINAAASPFSERLNTIKADVIQKDGLKESCYDAVVFNPPFFERCTAPTKRLGHARHLKDKTLINWLYSAYTSTKPVGECAFIIPHDQFQNILEGATAIGWYLKRCTNIRGNANAPIKRTLIQLVKRATVPQIDHIIIERERHEYTAQYKELTRDFYLKH